MSDNLPSHAALLAQAFALARSPEAIEIRKGWRRISEERLLELTQALVAKAKSQNADPLAWCIPSRVDGSGMAAVGQPMGLFHMLMPGPRTGKALAFLAQEGASPWAVSISQLNGGQVSWQDGAQIVSYGLGLGRGGNLNTQKRSLKAAAETALEAAKQGAGRFIPFLVASYEALCKRSSKTAKGVLGPAEKQARDSASSLVFAETALTALADSLGDAEGAKSLRAALADAKERLAAKHDKAGAAVNPEKLKKQLDGERRDRLGALMALCKSHARDEQLIGLAFDATDWLAAEPMAASLRFGRDGSLFHAALAGGSRSALAGLEKVGANIWLAAAQHGQANACMWAAESIPWRADDSFDLSPLARMLLVGAWLDGSDDPKARCLDLAREAREEAAKQPYRGDRIGKLCQILETLIERQTLDEIVAQFQDQLGEDVAAPKRARSL